MMMELPSVNFLPKFTFVNLLIITISIGANQINICPEKEELINCNCEIRYTQMYVKCQNLEDINILSNSLSVFTKYRVFSLELNNLHLMYLPAKIWSSFSIAELTIGSSEILGLEFQDSYKMFGNVMRSLEDLRLDRITGLNSWRWKAFKDFVKLKDVTITYSDLSAITEDFFHLSPQIINQIFLTHNQISYLHDRAFASHVNLMSLDLTGNMITDVKRSMFHDPSPMVLLYLGNNKIKTLPNDFFKAMPSLVEVNLENNRIQFLLPDLLRPLGNGRFQTVIKLKGNEIFCCSSMEELIKYDKLKTIDGKCANPSVLKGKVINELQVADVRHGFC